MTTGLLINQVRRISQSALEKLRHISQEGLVWKTTENDPRKHTPADEGLYYILPGEKQMSQVFGLSAPNGLEATKFYKTIGFTPMMIRRPALTAIDYIKKYNPSMPNVRMLFYGDYGHGKVHTLTHLIHYLHLSQEHFIIHVKEMNKFTRYKQELRESTSRPGRIDTPLYAAIFLQQFRVQNSQLLEQYKDTLVCSQDYKWSIREITKAGEPLANVADHGVNRVNHASDCVAVLLKELTLAADAGKIKLASFLDDVGLLFKREAGVLKHADHKKVLVDEVTVARALKKLIKGNHKGALLFAACDDHFRGITSKQNQTPQEILNVEAWQAFDPFLPINVPKYSPYEFENCMNMYQDIGWLTRPESRTREVRDEIRFVSGLNPYQVFYLCQSI